MEDFALTVAEVVQRTRIGRNAVYEAIARGELRVVRVGRRVIVPVSAIEEWLSSRMALAQ